MGSSLMPASPASCHAFPRTHQPLSTPAEYTQLYVERVAGQFAGGVSEVRTGHYNHDVAIMYRMGDRFSTWDAGNGLRSLIPTLLTSGVLGYPFCLPDMIGGNAYFNTHPDKELLVRWTQVNALMPAMQFSLAPVGPRQGDRASGDQGHLHPPQARGLSRGPGRGGWREPHAHMQAPVDDRPGRGGYLRDSRPVCSGERHHRRPRCVPGCQAPGRLPHRGLLARHRERPTELSSRAGRWLKNVASPLDHLPVYVRSDSSLVQTIFD